MPIPNLTYLQFSSSAELFFILSGYLVGLLYIPRDRGTSLQSTTARLVGRSSYLLMMNCFLFVATMAIGGFITRDAQHMLGITSAADEANLAAFHVLRLGYHLPLLGILNFYIIMMLAAIPFIYLLRFNQWIAISVSVATYGFSQLYPEISLIGGRIGGSGNGLMPFNIVAWQVLFLAGIVGGHLRVHELIRDNVMRKGKLLPVMGCAFAAFVLVRGVTWVFHLPMPPMIDKQSLGALRVLHSFIVIFFLAALLFAIPRKEHNKLYRGLCVIGANSLQCFVVSVLLSYLMAIVMHVWFDGQMSYYIVALAGCALLFVAGHLFTAFSKAKKGQLGAPNIKGAGRSMPST